MKITDYEKVRQLDESNIVLIDGNNGTKTILVSDFAKALIGLMNSKDFISGVNLSELDQIKTLSTNDKFLVGTAAGNKAIGANDALFAILDSFVPKEQRRMIYRGKNLGSVVTEEQKTNIKNGTFKGFFLGDYWTIGSYTWRIVDILACPISIGDGLRRMNMKICMIISISLMKKWEEMVRRRKLCRKSTNYPFINQHILKKISRRNQSWNRL